MTALAWNPRHGDLFAAGYGSYDFLRQAGGSVACFTLKNPSHPECLLTTSSGVWRCRTNSGVLRQVEGNFRASPLMEGQDPRLLT